MTLVIAPAGARFRTAATGRESAHSFSFGASYDPGNVSFGALLAHNDERLEPGAGYPSHRHSGLEIVTWVVAGALVHSDSTGASESLPAGTVQVQSAGRGIEHAEFADAGTGQTRFVQAWLRSNRPDDPPSRRTHRVSGLLGPVLVRVVSGDGGAPLAVASRGATLWAAAPAAGHRVRLSDALLVHAFLATGAASLVREQTGPAPSGQSRHPEQHVNTPVRSPLEEGDAVRLTTETGWSLVAAQPSLILVWTFAAE